MADAFIHRLRNNVYDRWITSNFPCKWHRTASTRSGWKSSTAKIFHCNSSGERRLNSSRAEKTTTTTKREAERTSLRTAKATSSSQRPQTCTERQNTTITLQTNRWREGTPNADASKSNEEIRQHLNFTVKIIFDVTRSVQCTSRISFQRTEDSRSAFDHEQQWVLQ